MTNNDFQGTARQWKLEAEAARVGAQKLLDATNAAEQKAYASGTVWGRSLINQKVTAITALIEDRKVKLWSGAAAKDGSVLTPIFSLMEANVMAVIAAKKILDLACMPKDEKGRYQNIYQRICIKVGREIEQEARFRWYEATASKDWQIVQSRYFKKTTGTAQKKTISSVMMNRRGHQWKTWAEAVCMKLGAFLVDQVATATQWVELRTIHENSGKNRRTTNILCLSQNLLNKREELTALAQLEVPMAWPMVCEPADWTNETRGGYLSNELRHVHKLVRTKGFGSKSVPVVRAQPLEALNTLQRVAYRINPVTLSVMEYCYDAERTLGSFCLEADAPIPPRPEGDSQDPAVKEWRRDATDAYNHNAALTNKRHRSLQTLDIAQRFAAEEKFWVPWSFDYRGRTYPLISYMSPQGTDMEKALYLFADARPVTSENFELVSRWLAIHLANTAGQDKKTLDERVEWTKANSSFISAVASDPISHLAEIKHVADEPWCFIAACAEYHAVCITREQTETSIPVATDATCSGLQHLSAATLDASTGHLVNVSSTPAPQDAYKAVLKETINRLRAAGKADLADWGEKVGRSLAKRVVMTIPYAATEESNRKYIREALLKYENELHEEDNSYVVRKPSNDEVNTITKHMRAAMSAVVPGPVAVMQWIKDSVREYYRNPANKNKDIIWDSPSGFTVVQTKKNPKTTRVTTKLLGSAIESRVADGWTPSPTPRSTRPVQLLTGSTQWTQLCSIAPLPVTTSRSPSYTIRSSPPPLTWNTWAV